MSPQKDKKSLRKYQKEWHRKLRERQRKLRGLRNFELYALLRVLADAKEGAEIPCRLVSVKLDKPDVESGVTTFSIFEEEKLNMPTLLRPPEEKVLYRTIMWLSVLANSSRYGELLKEMEFPYPIAISERGFVLKAVPKEYADKLWNESMKRLYEDLKQLQREEE